VAAPDCCCRCWAISLKTAQSTLALMPTAFVASVSVFRVSVSCVSVCVLRARARVRASPSIAACLHVCVCVWACVTIVGVVWRRDTVLPTMQLLAMLTMLPDVADAAVGDGIFLLLRTLLQRFCSDASRPNALLLTSIASVLGNICTSTSVVSADPSGERVLALRDLYKRCVACARVSCEVQCAPWSYVSSDRLPSSCTLSFLNALSCLWRPCTCRLVKCSASSPAYLDNSACMASVLKLVRRFCAPVPGGSPDLFAGNKAEAVVRARVVFACVGLFMRVWVDGFAVAPVRVCMHLHVQYVCVSVSCARLNEMPGIILPFFVRWSKGAV
jgi:hypothetical protein